MDPFAYSASNSQSCVKNEAVNEDYDENIALPLHLQRLENAMRVDNLFRQVQSFIEPPHNSVSNESTVSVSKQHLRTIKTRLYNLSKVKKNKKWIKDILLDKSDSSDSELEVAVNGDSGRIYEESISDMIKFENLKRKYKQGPNDVKDEPVATRTPKFYSSELLGSSFDLKTQSMTRSSTNEDLGNINGLNGPTSTSGKGKKPKASSTGAKNTGGKKKQNRATPSPSPAIPTTTGVAVKEVETPDRTNISTLTKGSLLLNSNQPSPSVNLTKANSSLVEALSKVDSPLVQSAVESKNSLNLTSSSRHLNSSLSLSVDSVDSIRYKERLLDEIPYDMTLPDEILQTESSFNPPSAIISRLSVTEEIVYNTNLPDEIFDTEESNISVISQTLSSPSPSVNLYNPSANVKLNSAISRPVTAPSTPTGLTSSHAGKNKSKSLQPRRHVSKNNLNAPLGVSSPDTTDAFQRKKVWMFIIKNEIPRVQTQMLATKVSNCTIRKLLADSCKQKHFSVIIKWRNATSPSSSASVGEEMFQFWSKEQETL